MSLLRLSRAGVVLREAMARRSDLTLLDILLSATISSCNILLYRSHQFQLINAYPFTLYISSGFAGSKYLHWLGGEGVSKLSYLSSVYRTQRE